MELELSRVDYAVVGVTNAKCMKILPKSERSDGSCQKVAVADDDGGALRVFSVRKGEVQSVFKAPTTGKITRIELGGATDHRVADKIYVACDGEVKGFTKKGKQFLGFDTNLTEPITAMYVEGSDLLVCGRHSFYHYQDCKESNYVLCGDAINDVVALNSFKTNRLTPVLACEDKMLRVVDHSAVSHAVAIDSPPTVLHLYENDGGSRGDRVLYGTRSGGVGLLTVARPEVKAEWLIEPDGNKDAITCLDCYDITGNGVSDIIVGRSDGLVEVYSASDRDEPLKLVYSYTCNETITSIQGGVVGASGFQEIIVVTFSGWIFGLTTEPTGKNLAVTADSGYLAMSQDSKQKLHRLREEVSELEERIAREREKYQSVIQESENSVSAIPMIAVNEKFYLNKDDASYNFCLEVQTSIDNVLIQSDVPVELLDVEKNSAVVSFSDCDPAEGNFVLATYRCQLNTTRLDLKISTIEGQHGSLRVYITPNIQPKSCQLRRYRIKPLSLHVRAHSFDPTAPYNRLRLKGGFSLAEIHSWIELCLPDVPERAPPGESAVLIFTSAFVGTTLKCTYSKGKAEFESDNVSTISILKDVISKEATKSNKNRNVEISWDINDASVEHTLRLLHPKLEHQLELLRKISILQSVTELDLSKSSTENDASLLTDEYVDIIARESVIVEEYKRRPSQLNRLCGAVADLFVDKNKFHGLNVRNKVPLLLESLTKDAYSFDALLDFFRQ